MKELKPQELRIGNWIIHEARNYTFQVDEGTFTYLRMNPNFYQPIPLTEEWLIKLGFKETWSDGKNRKEFTISKPHFYLFHYKSGEKEYCKWEGLDIDTSKIHFVHQLQNLYFDLTGEEL